GAAPGRHGWTPGRIVSVVAGALLVLCSLGLLGAGGAALWADTAARDGGYVNVSSETYRTSGYAVASDTVDLHWGGGWDSARALLGTPPLPPGSPAGAPGLIGIAPPRAG